MTGVLREQELSPMKLEVLGVDDWALVVEETAAGMARSYAAVETTFIIDGAAEILFDGEVINIAAGDLVTFLPGTECVWNVSGRMERRVQ